MQSFLGIAEAESSTADSVVVTPVPSVRLTESESTPPEPVMVAVSVEEYFSHIDLNGRDVGRQTKVAEKVCYFFFHNFSNKIIIKDNILGTTV